MKAIDLLKLVEEKVYSNLVNKWSGSEHFCPDKMPDFDGFFQWSYNGLYELSVSGNCITGTYVVPKVNDGRFDTELDKEVYDGVWVYSITGHNGEFLLSLFKNRDMAEAEAKELKKDDYCTNVFIIDTNTLK